MSALGSTTCEGGCGRQVDPEDLVQVGDKLVCEPCQASATKAAERRDSIDDAWRAVEATLPDGYRLSGLLLADDADAPPDAPWVAIAELDAVEVATIGEWLDAMRQDVNARGATPSKALRALAKQLHETYGSGAT